MIGKRTTSLDEKVLLLVEDNPEAARQAGLCCVLVKDASQE